VKNSHLTNKSERNCDIKGDVKMEVGNEEWLKRVSANYKFPCKIAFVLIKENDDTVAMVSTEIKGKSQVENTKFSHISKSTWTSKGSAVLSIGEYDNPQQYLTDYKKLKDIWGYALV
jgi:hypothetical protein